MQYEIRIKCVCTIKTISSSKIIVRIVWIVKIFTYGKRMGFGMLDALLSLPVLVVYSILDLFVVLILVLYQPLLDKLIEHHVGSKPGARSPSPKLESI